MKIVSAEFERGVAGIGQLRAINPERRPEIVFLGRSNVGKSSLINKLLNRKNLAKTSSVPGKTQQINYFRINDEIFFVDLPGYGFARVPKSVKEQWSRLLETYLTGNLAIACGVVILDSRREPSALDFQMAEWMAHYRYPFVFAVTKADKLSGNELSRQMAMIKRATRSFDAALVPFSANTGRGKEEIWDYIETMLDKANKTPTLPSNSANISSQIETE